MRQLVKDRHGHIPTVQESVEPTDTSAPAVPAAACNVDSLPDAGAPPSRALPLGWVGVTGLLVGGGMLAAMGHLEIGALTGAASMLATSWMFGYRGRVHRWPTLLNDARNRDAAAS